MKRYLTYRTRSLRRIYLLFERLPAIQLAIGLCIGIILANLSYALVFSLSLICLIRKSRYLLLFSLGLILGLGVYELSYGSREQSNIAKFYNQEITTIAEVVSNPKLREFEQEVQLVTANVPGKILAKLPKYPLLNMHDQITISLNLKSVHDTESSGYREYLNSSEIRYISSAKQFVLIKKQQSPIAKVKIALQQLIEQHLGEPHAGLLIGMLIGESASFDPELDENLQNSGTSHIVSVSGFNVSVLLMLLLGAAGFVHRRLLTLLIPTLLISYLLLVGWNNLPAQRAVIMSLAIFIPLLIGRKSGIYFAITYSVVFMLIQNVLVWRNISFQLSFTALLGLLFLANILEPLFGKLPSLIRTGVATTLAALIATIPITAFSFGQLSLVALPANIFVLPLVPIAMYSGLISLLLSWIPIIGDFAFWVTNLILDYIIQIINLFGRLAFAVTENVLLINTVYLAMISLVLIADYRQFKGRRNG